MSQTENTIDLEKQILSEILKTDTKDQLDYLSQLGTKDFQNDKWRELFKIFCEISLENKPVETFEVYKRAKDLLSPNEILVMEEVFSNTLLQEHIFQLKEHTYKRELYKSAVNGLKLLKQSISLDETEEAKNKIISDLSGISVSDSSKFIDFISLREKLFDNISKNHEIEGISWGIRELDQFTSGIMIPRLYVLGGLKKGGKSRFVINLIKNLSNQQIKNAFISLEMPAYEIVKLIHSTFTGIDDLKLRSKTFISNEERKLLENTFIPKQYFDVECISGITIEGVLGRLRRFAKQGYKVIFIDYLQRIKHDRNRQAQELEEISIKIADATRANNISIILLSQLNGLAENGTPSVGNLKGSGGIGEAADTILLFDNLFRRTKKEEDKNRIDIILEQRYGDSGTVHLAASLGTCDIVDLETEHLNNYRTNYTN